MPVRMTSPGSQGELLRQVGDEPGEGEEQTRGRVVLAISPLTQVRIRSACRVDGCGRDAAPGRRSEAVAALGTDVRALVRVLDVVDAEVVARRHPAPTWAHASSTDDPPGGGADHEGDLALEGQQLGAGRSFDRAAAEAPPRTGLEEVGGVGGLPSALRGAGTVAQVDGDDLAGLIEGGLGVHLLQGGLQRCFQGVMLPSDKASS